jgi:membrane-bound serine protease (ClpP class)
MLRVFTLLTALLLATALVPARAAEALPAPIVKTASGLTRVTVIPVREAIDEPVLYVVRRALKDAIAAKADVVVLDMKTPGGRGDVMFEIIEALDKFPGETLTFINDEAGSAGALIAGVTREIWFAPRAVMGAAEPVTGQGEDIDESMKRKVMSFFAAKLRAYGGSEGDHRTEVLRAMMDPKFELKIGETVIKAKDELLTLTGEEAMKTYGEPAKPLLTADKAETVDELLTKKFGVGGYVVTRIELTWSEGLASWLNKITPILMALGLLALFIEFKTPGFGAFGITGITLLVVVFLSSYVAGLSGHEPLLLFALGVGLIAAELLLFPGTAVAGVTGLALVLGSLVWATADLWPNEPLAVAWGADAFARPLLNVVLGVLLAFGLALALLRYLPQGWFWDRLAISSVTGVPQRGGRAAAVVGEMEKLLGREGVAATDLRPGGLVEVDGMRLEARLMVGSAAAGERVRIVGMDDFCVKVERRDV